MDISALGSIIFVNTSAELTFVRMNAFVLTSLHLWALYTASMSIASLFSLTLFIWLSYRTETANLCTGCDRVKISPSDGYRPLELSSGCDCIVEEDGESSRHDHSRE
jgi:hypothetical protein